MNIYLARHGAAVADILDPARPLSPAGRQDVERVARLAAEKVVKVNLIYHSGILRAAQTAEILATHLKPGRGVEESSGLRPEDDPYLAAADLSLAAEPVMLVGHLPHLGRLAALLTIGDPSRKVIDWAPGMMACFAREDPAWRLDWVIAPD